MHYRIPAMIPRLTYKLFDVQSSTASAVVASFQEENEPDTGTSNDRDFMKV